MEETKIRNPYVEQIDKFSRSLEHLSVSFLRREETRRTFTKAETDEMMYHISQKVCEGCEHKERCFGENEVHTYQMVYEILRAVEEYGMELNTEIKRKLQKYCTLAPRFLRETLETFQNAKQVLFWNNRMVQNREGCAMELTAFAKMIQHAARELNASMFSDEHLEKKIRERFRKNGIWMLSSVFFMTPEGRYEIHVTVRVKKGQCITTKELARHLSDCTGRAMIPAQNEPLMVGTQYSTVICMESARFHTLCGVAKIGKGCSGISGDSFLMMQLPGGKEGAVLSDGMGSGQEAFQESAMILEMLEELLDAGFPKETALQMMNTALVMGREEIRFSTVDISVFDLYQGSCEIVKAGASTTFIKHEGKVERISSTNLPLGVMPELEVEAVKRQLSNGDFVIMLTDGVLDALPAGEQELILEKIIEGTQMNNPKEMAHHMLEQVLEWSGEEPLDDMTVLVVGLWEF